MTLKEQNIRYFADKLVCAILHIISPLVFLWWNLVQPNTGRLFPWHWTFQAHPLKLQRKILLLCFFHLQVVYFCCFLVLNPFANFFFYFSIHSSIFLDFSRFWHFSSVFLVPLLRCNWHTINCIFLMCAIWLVLTIHVLMIPSLQS